MGRWGLAWLAAVAAVAAAVAAGSSATRLSRRPFSPPPKERRPNIVLIMTDDQDVELGSLNFMPRLLRHVRDGGAEFRHAYTTTPMCCPSRSSMLTGMYMHNHMVYTNNDNCSSPQWQATHETRSFATYLSNAGYRTGYFGKYLNKYNGSYIPPGWREWGGLIMNSRYYNYSINLNGKKIKHGDQYDKDYYPDLIANDSINFLRQSKQYFSRKPVMLVLGFPAPHGPEDSAPQYSKMFFNVTTHHTPSYDYAPNPDKQWILQVTGRMQPIHRQFTDLLMTKRLQTLQSVDVAVERIIEELKALGELDNTYIMYTSDHGYHLGQFGLVKGKSFPFEFDVRVPFLVRGPGIEPGTIVDEIVLNIDLAPTFLDIAGVEPPQHMDGRSILRLLNRKHRSRANSPPAKWPDTFLIESSGRRDIADTIATEVKLKESLKKLQRDLNVTLISAETDISYLSNSTSSSEIGQNVTADVLADGIPDEIKAVAKEAEDGQLDNQLLPVPAPGVSKLERLAMECQRPEYKPPCRPGQKWFCLSDGIRWRKHKCKLHANVLPQPKVKKCACFTPTGHLYTRIEHDERRLQRDFVRNPASAHEMREFRPKFARDMRYKRDITEDEDERTNKMGPFDKYRPHIKIVGNRRRNRVDLVREEELETKAMESLEKLQSFFNSSQIEEAVDEAVLALREFNGARNRRAVVGEGSIDTEVNEMMGHLEKEIFGLQESNSRNTSLTVADPNCTIGKGGRIFCTEDIYSDPKAWKASRDLLEYQIKKLKTRLDKLKEIRRHLKEKRPLIAYDDSLEDDDEEKSSADMSIEGDASNSTGTPTQRNRHRHHHSEARMKDIPAHPPTPSPTIRSTYLGRGKGHVGVPPTRLDMAALDPSRTFGSQRPKQTYIPDTCYCEPDLPPYKDEKELAKEAKRKMKEDRMKKRERKLRRKAKFEVECLAERMNCFNHDNDHWKTPPFWNEGPFCFCMNANNNTYSCLRTINATHNFLYCEFITGLITYYNLRIDPFEQWNRINSLTNAEKTYLHNQLEILKSCRGVRQCTLGSSQPTAQSNKPRRRNYHTISFGHGGEGTHVTR